MQINSKLRGRIVVPGDADANAVQILACNNETIAAALGDATVKKAIYIPKRLLNLIV